MPEDCLGRGHTHEDADSQLQSSHGGGPEGTTIWEGVKGENIAVVGLGVRVSSGNGRRWPMIKSIPSVALVLTCDSPQFH
jgi:hypothetical protein